MYRTLLKSKIHRATVTAADLDYEGSITVDPELLDAADIREHDGVWKVFYKAIPQGRCAELLRCAQAMDFTD